MKKNSLPILVFTLGGLLLASCAPKKFNAIETVAADTKTALGCSDFESRTWDAMNRYLIEEKSLLSREELNEHLKSSLQGLKTRSGSLSDEQREQLARDLEDLFEVFLSEAPQLEKIQNSQELLTLLSALELGDHTSDSKKHLQTRVKAQFLKVQSRAETLGVECEAPPTVTPEIPEGGDSVHAPAEQDDRASSQLPRPVYGMRFAFATAYQSCHALGESVINQSTPEIDSAGIKITGTHPDGIGSRRVIASITALLRSHPYYKNTNSYDRGCLNGHDYPMIYDYGGKPYATTGANSTFDFFKNGGNGTSALGTDCSGLIYTGLATAGLRLAPNKVVKASGVNGISSRMYVEPQENGLTCLEKITLSANSDLKAGDIVAVPGHVLMIDSVGSDPFGLNGVQSAADCAKVAARNFNFVVIQSSPSKNAVGMNRFEARDYLYESEKMRVGLEKYATYACLARINNKSYTPNLGTLSVIRHKMTSSCLGTRIKLARESCVQSCPQLAR